MEGEELEYDEGVMRFSGHVCVWWKENFLDRCFGELYSHWLPWLGDSEYDERSEPRIGVEELLSIILMLGEWRYGEDSNL